MGYTHYYYRPVKVDHDVETWKRFIDNCKTLYKNMPEHSHSSGDYSSDEPLFLSGCFKYEKPQFTASHVVFNGSNGLKRIKRYSHCDKGCKHIEWLDAKSEDESLNDLGHETFVIERKARPQEGHRKDEDTLFSFCKTARKPYDLMVQACLILYKHSDGEMDDWTEAFKFVAVVIPEGKEIGTALLINDTLFEQAS
jgi:hypothetical protein